MTIPNQNADLLYLWRFLSLQTLLLKLRYKAFLTVVIAEAENASLKTDQEAI